MIKTAVYEENCLYECVHTSVAQKVLSLTVKKLVL